MIDVVVKLDIDLVLQLTIFLEEVFVIDGICKVLIIFGEEVHFAVVGPGVELISHRVLRPNADVLAASK